MVLENISLASQALYCDGGVILKNPSTIGGTWAVRLVAAGQVVRDASGTITPAEAETTAITNQLAELYSLVRGLEQLPPDWVGVVFSDCECALGRAFMGWRWSNLPAWLHHRYQAARARLVHWSEIGHVLLDGHPTRAQLAAGIGKRGHLVSEHNRWCDLACQAEAGRFVGAALNG